MTSEALIQDPSTREFIVAPGERVAPGREPDCVVPVSVPYQIWYYREGRLPELSMKNYPYTAIPKCYGLLSAAALEDAGIFKLRQLPVLDLGGKGVLLAVIDTGIDYTLPAFRDEGGATRIRALWDQTALSVSEETGEDGAGDTSETGSGLAGDREPECMFGLPYGRAYSREEIDRALASEDPYGIVPQRDDDGHGTLLASIAGGSPDPAKGFLGAAPEVCFAVVKLRPAKPYLRDFYFIPEGAAAYAESDILSALSFVEKLSEELAMPCVVLMGLGTNNGSHSGAGPLCEALDILGQLQRRAVVCASGNEAGKRHHFQGRAESVLTPRKVELRVERDMKGFYLEFWGLSPERFSLSVQSPTGELLSRAGTFAQANQEVTFLFEGTRLTVDYQAAGQARRDQLIFLRFERAVRGIWTIRIYPENAVTGDFHLWLPMEEMLEGPVYFLEPSPDVTLTSPSDAWIPMTVGGWNGSTAGIYADSGRGFDSDGRIKPDFVAPGVNVPGAEAGLLGMEPAYIPLSGTSASAALTAGACALLLEWAAVGDNAPNVNSVDLKNLLIRGAGRREGMAYPTTTEGYGTLQVYEAFESLRRRS